METEIELIRHTFTDKSTIGSLYIDKVFECFVLEDKDRLLRSDMKLEEINKIKIDTKTCIPYGRYPIAVTWSNRFKQLMPLVMDVPGYAGIRIHPGNKAEDTEGCLLVGKTKGADFVGNSRDEYAIIFKKLTDACAKGKVWITITKEQLSN